MYQEDYLFYLSERYRHINPLSTCIKKTICSLSLRVHLSSYEIFMFLNELIRLRFVYLVRVLIGDTRPSSLRPIDQHHPGDKPICSDQTQSCPLGSRHRLNSHKRILLELIHQQLFDQNRIQGCKLRSICLKLFLWWGGGLVVGGGGLVVGGYCTDLIVYWLTYF